MDKRELEDAIFCLADYLLCAANCAHLRRKYCEGRCGFGDLRLEAKGEEAAYDDAYKMLSRMADRIKQDRVDEAAKATGKTEKEERK